MRLDVHMDQIFEDSFFFFLILFSKDLGVQIKKRFTFMLFDKWNTFQVFATK